MGMNEQISNPLFEKSKNLCDYLNNYISILVKFIEKVKCWTLYIIDRIKRTFEKRGSSHSESNHSSAKNFVI